jgi:hypothetical protein
LSFGIAELKRAQAEACATNKKERQARYRRYKKRNAPAWPGRSLQQGYYTAMVMRVKLKN